MQDHTETPAPPTGTVVSARNELNGDLKVKGDVQVRGKVIGSVWSDGVVEVDGVVDGSVRGAEVICRGTIKGNVRASVLIRLEKGCFLGGDATAPAIVRMEGASHNGKLRCQVQRRRG